MQDFREACIIFSAENYTEALYVKEFMKWIGVSYFTYVYNEIDEKLNMDVLKNDNNFDVVFYINSKGKVWNGCLDALTKARVSISCESIWDKNSLLETPLKEAMDCICDCFQWGETQVKAVFEKLVSIYCKYDVLRKLVNNVYSIVAQLSRQKSKIFIMN